MNILHELFGQTT